MVFYEMYYVYYASDAKIHAYHYEMENMQLINLFDFWDSKMADHFYNRSKQIIITVCFKRHKCQVRKLYSPHHNTRLQ